MKLYVVRVVGIEPTSPDWKPGIISRYTIPAKKMRLPTQIGKRILISDIRLPSGAIASCNDNGRNIY